MLTHRRSKIAAVELFQGLRKQDCKQSIIDNMFIHDTNSQTNNCGAWISQCDFLSHTHQCQCDCFSVILMTSVTHIVISGSDVPTVGLTSAVQLRQCMGWYKDSFVLFE